MTDEYIDCVTEKLFMGDVQVQDAAQACFKPDFNTYLEAAKGDKVEAIRLFYTEVSGQPFFQEFVDRADGDKAAAFGEYLAQVVDTGAQDGSMADLPGVYGDHVTAHAGSGVPSVDEHWLEYLSGAGGDHWVATARNMADGLAANTSMHIDTFTTMVNDLSYQWLDAFSNAGEQAGKIALGLGVIYAAGRFVVAPLIYQRGELKRAEADAERDRIDAQARREQIKLDATIRSRGDLAASLMRDGKDPEEVKKTLADLFPLA